MKKIFISLLLISIGIITGILLTNNVYRSYYSNNIVSNTSTSNLVKSNSIAMMIETDLGSNEYFLSTDTTWPDSSSYSFNGTLSKCENGSSLSWDIDNNQVLMTGSSSDKCYIYFDVIVEFDYTGGEQTLTITNSGTYKLEVWGAGGAESVGYMEGSGGYSVGEIYLEKGTVLYINVGGAGGSRGGMNGGQGGYNGGGTGGDGIVYNTSTMAGGSGGGGATHIAFVSGILSSLEDYIGDYDDNSGVYRSTEILIVAGGGGGSASNAPSVGSGGGFTGVSATTYSGSVTCSAGTQTTGYAFGQGEDGRTSTGYYSYGAEGTGGSGGGFFGGYSCTIIGIGTVAAGSGGSGYIGNSSLTNKAMYCYECSESTDEDTYTVSTTNVSDTATSMYAKSGNGYARITKVS